MPSAARAIPDAASARVVIGQGFKGRDRCPRFQLSQPGHVLVVERPGLEVLLVQAEIRSV